MSRMSAWRVTRVCGFLVAVALVAATPPRTTLEGRVRSRQPRTAVEGVSVTLRVAGRTERTDADGRFSFGATPIAGGDTLVVTHPDFSPVLIPLGTPTAPTWTLDLLLSRQTIRVTGGIARR